MGVKKYIRDSDIELSLKAYGFKQTVDEGRLMLLELLVKANAGYYNSHTEEMFLNSFEVTRKDRIANKKGRQFICSMIYASSNKKPKCFSLIEKYRKN
jgi:hypothetical protein